MIQPALTSKVKLLFNSSSGICACVIRLNTMTQSSVMRTLYTSEQSSWILANTAEEVAVSAPWGAVGHTSTSGTVARPAVAHLVMGAMCVENLH